MSQHASAKQRDLTGVTELNGNSVITPQVVVDLHVEQLLAYCRRSLERYSGKPVTVYVTEHCLPEAVTQCLEALSHSGWVAFQRHTWLGHELRIGRAGELSLAETRSQTGVSRFFERVTKFVARCS